MGRANLGRIRKICLSLPEAKEIEAWGSATFRIGKIFAMYADADNHHGEGREGIWVKSDHFTQDLLVRGQPTRYFKPPYVGPQGWTGVYLDANTDWIALTVLLRDAYRVTAPKKLAALVPDDDGDAPPKRPAARKRVAKKKSAARKKSSARKKSTAKRGR